MAIFNYEYQSDFARRYFSQGEARGEARGVAKGQARALLAILDARGVSLPKEVRERVACCTNHDLLETWVRQAANARGIWDVFVGQGPVQNAGRRRRAAGAAAPR